MNNIPIRKRKQCTFSCNMEYPGFFLSHALRFHFYPVPSQNIGSETTLFNTTLLTVLFFNGSQIFSIKNGVHSSMFPYPLKTMFQLNENSEIFENGRSTIGNFELL